MRTAIQKSSSTPVYIQIAEAIREDIRKGRLPVGSALPAERILCGQFSVSRMTLRQAYDLLEREGLIECQRGRGTFVAQKRLQKQQQEMRSFTQEILARGGKPSSRILSFTQVSQSLAAREFFGLPEAEPLWELKRVRLSDDVPLALECTQIPRYLCPTLDRFNLATQSLYRILE